MRIPTWGVCCFDLTHDDVRVLLGESCDEGCHARCIALVCGEGIVLRRYSKLDAFLIRLERLRALTDRLRGAESVVLRASPADGVRQADALTESDRRHSGGLMRVNHAGEVCAQALYLGQLLMARSEQTADFLQHACEEEQDHLQWTASRLADLQASESRLNVAWFVASFGVGVLAATVGDQWSLAFVAETEQQVGRHLDRHLAACPPADLKSRAVIQLMQADERAHGDLAFQMSHGSVLPRAVKRIMHWQSKVLTTLAYYI